MAVYVWFRCFKKRKTTFCQLRWLTRTTDNPLSSCMSATSMLERQTERRAAIWFRPRQMVRLRSPTSALTHFWKHWMTTNKSKKPWSDERSEGLTTTWMDESKIRKMVGAIHTLTFSRRKTSITTFASRLTTYSLHKLQRLSKTSAESGQSKKLLASCKARKSRRHLRLNPNRMSSITHASPKTQMKLSLLSSTNATRKSGSKSFPCWASQ